LLLAACFVNGVGFFMVEGFGLAPKHCLLTIDLLTMVVCTPVECTGSKLLLQHTVGGIHHDNGSPLISTATVVREALVSVS
jgi:hypothetical protein